MIVQCYKRYMAKPDYAVLVDKYLEAKKLAWSDASKTSESYRLRKMVQFMDGTASTLWRGIEHLKPYSRVTAWNRASTFYDWCVSKKLLPAPNPYAAFREENARQFKNAYVKVTPKDTFEDVYKKVDSISVPEVRKQALEILMSGMRYTESCTHANGYVTGKGNKTRRVYVPAIPGPTDKVNYRTFLRVLKDQTGYKPHYLRKVFLTKLVNSGADIFQLQDVAGWASPNTASSYIQANSDKTQKLIAQIHGVDSNVFSLPEPKKQVS